MQIHKVYLIAVQAPGDDEDEDGYRAGFRLDLDTVFVLDHQARTLARCQVERQTENSGENDQVLCIRYAQTHCYPRIGHLAAHCMLALLECMRWHATEG